MKPVFLDYDQAALDAQYDQRVWAPDMDATLQRCADASDAVRARIGQPVTHSYGKGAAERLDVYGNGKGKALVFVHGGAWRRALRRDSAFFAEALVRKGALCVVLGFNTLPAVTLPEMVSQVCRGIEWVAGHLSGDVMLCGHSSGAHLAACALARTEIVKRALLVSGIYDLLAVRLSSRNAFMRLDETLEHEFSPLRHAARVRCPLTVAWAEKESDEFARQSREFAAALGAPMLVASGLDHFRIIETLADGASPLGHAALQLLE